MKRVVATGLAMLASAALGAAAVDQLHAQNKAPGAYAVIEINEITDADTFTKQLLPKAAPAMKAFGGEFAILTEKITPIDGTPPKRFVVIGFDSIDKAKAWDASAAQKEINALRAKSTRSRAYIVDGAVAAPQ
jgi:uncharacterized protein (DUF1330 family)